MKNDTKIFSSKEVAKRLLVEPVTVRKYSQLLEEQGYSCQKDEKGWRQYSEHDIRYLEYLCNMKSTGKSLEESVKHVASLYHASLSILSSDTTLQEENPLLNFIKEQQEFNNQIIDRFEAQEKRQKERDINVINALNQSLEVKKQWWKFWK